MTPSNPDGTYDQQHLDRRIDDRLERDYLAAARMRYGDVAWRADERAGARLSREAAIAYALGERSEPLQPQTDQGGASASADQRSDDRVQ